MQDWSKIMWYDNTNTSADDLFERAAKAAQAIVTQWDADGADQRNKPAAAVAMVEWSVRWGFIEEHEVEHLSLRW